MGVQRGIKKPRSRSPEPLPHVKNHGVAGYRQGCGCDTCVTGATEYNATYRAGLKGCDPIDTPTPNNVRQIERARTTRAVVESSNSVMAGRNESTALMGDIEKAVIEETSGLSIAAERPAMVATARSMARILDNPKQAALHPTTSRQLTSILNDLRGQSKKRTRSRLASVQRMTTSEKSTGTT